jgi:hypothetical protein
VELSADEQERFEERAAILEYCAHLPRAEAERQAREMVRRAGTPQRAVVARDEGDLKPCAAAASAMGTSRGPRATDGAVAALNEAKRMLKP